MVRMDQLVVLVELLALLVELLALLVEQRVEPSCRTCS